LGLLDIVFRFLPITLWISSGTVTHLSLFFHRTRNRSFALSEVSQLVVDAETTRAQLTAMLVAQQEISQAD
jgi:hypothetical protein